MNKFCNQTGVGLIPWSPLYRGVLARPLDTPDTVRASTAKVNDGVTEADREIVRRVQELANRKDWKMSHVALVWIIQKGTIPIVGFSNLSRLHEACGVRGKSLTEEEMKYLEEPYKPKEIAGHR